MEGSEWIFNLNPLRKIIQNKDEDNILNLKSGKAVDR